MARLLRSDSGMVGRLRSDSGMVGRFRCVTDTDEMRSNNDGISVEPVESWPLFSGLDVSGMAAAVVGLTPSASTEVHDQVRLAASELLANPSIGRLLSTREFVVFAQTPALHGTLNRLGRALAERKRLWGTFDDDELPLGRRSEFPITEDPTGFCGAIRVESGDEMRALELSYNHHALCVALVPGADLEALAQGFGATQTWQESLRWGAAIVSSGAMVFRPWDWMDDKDAGVEIWAASNDLLDLP